jgi:hypothetical protein
MGVLAVAPRLVAPQVLAIHQALRLHKETMVVSELLMVQVMVLVVEVAGHLRLGEALQIHQRPPVERVALELHRPFLVLPLLMQEVVAAQEILGEPIPEEQGVLEVVAQAELCRLQMQLPEPQIPEGVEVVQHMAFHHRVTVAQAALA